MMQSVKKATFCSHDENETVLVYDNFYKKWDIEDKRGLSISFDKFPEAMYNMSIITGMPFENWTILGE